MGTKRTDIVELLKRLRISLDDERSGNVQEPRQRYADFLRNILKPHLFEPNSMKKEEEEEESSGSRHHHRRSSSNGSSASTTTKEVVYNHSDDQNPIPASNDHVVHPSTNEWSQLPSDFNFLPFHEEWTSQNVIPYATESPNFAPSGTNYLSSMMNSASQFWFQWRATLPINSLQSCSYHAFLVFSFFSFFLNSSHCKRI